MGKCAGGIGRPVSPNDAARPAVAPYHSNQVCGCTSRVARYRQAAHSGGWIVSIGIDYRNQIIMLDMVWGGWYRCRGSLTKGNRLRPRLGRRGDCRSPEEEARAKEYVFAKRTHFRGWVQLHNSLISRLLRLQRYMTCDILSASTNPKSARKVSDGWRLGGNSVAIAARSRGKPGRSR